MACHQLGLPIRGSTLTFLPPEAREFTTIIDAFETGGIPFCFLDSPD
jgi:hypothetical protein